MGPKAPANKPRQLRWQYLLPLRYGPWALALTGIFMVIAGVLTDRPAAVLSTLVVTGSGLLVGGALLPRVAGVLELLGVRARLSPVQEVDPQALRPALLARTEAALPEGRNRQKLAEQVTDTVAELLGEISGQAGGAVVSYTAGADQVLLNPLTKRARFVSLPDVGRDSESRIAAALEQELFKPSGD